MAGSWEKRGDGAYRLTVDLGKDFKGKRIRKRKTVRCTSDRQADKELAKFFAECQNDEAVYSGKITVSALADKYLETCAKTNTKKSTYSGYVSIIRTSIKPLLGKHPVEKITPLHIQEWVNYMLDNGISPKTISNRFGLMRNMMESAIDWHMITKNPCNRVKLPRYKKPEADFYSKEEVAEIVVKLMLLDNKQYLAFKTAIMIDLFSGLRKAELIGLKWDKINLTTGEYKIDSTRMYTPEQGTYTDTPKTDSGTRDLTFPKFCVDLLRKLKKQQAERRLLLGENWGPDNGFVFLSDKGTPIGTSTLYKQFVAFLDREKIRKTKLHTLRHTNASMIHSLNNNSSELSKWMGHSKISTTTDIYTHLFNSNSKKEIADKLQQSFVPIVSPKAKTNA